MRTVFLLTAAAIALVGCGSNPTNSTADMNSPAMDDNAVVPPSETSVVPAMDNAMATARTADEYAMKSAMCDLYEIESSKLAATLGSTAALKSYASQMVDAHMATTAGLKAALASDSVSAKPPTSLDAKHQGMIDALKAAKGSAFDALYKSQQAQAHSEALTLHRGFATGGSAAALKTFASETASKVQMHIDMLKKLS